MFSHYFLITNICCSVWSNIVWKLVEENKFICTKYILNRLTNKNSCVLQKHLESERDETDEGSQYVKCEIL